MDGELLESIAGLLLGPAGVNACAGTPLFVGDYSEEGDLSSLVRSEAEARGIPLAPQGLAHRSIIIKARNDAGGTFTVTAEDFAGGWPGAQTIIPEPTEDWIRSRGGDDPGSFVSALRAAFRLDEDDPEASWITRHDFLEGVRVKLERLEVSALHFEGASGMTDLTVPIASSSVWNSGRAHTRDGVSFAPNLPCEEVFAAPDWRGVTGTAVVTRPFNWGTGSADGGELTIRFNGAGGVEIPNAPGSLIAALGGDLESVRIGEVALVDGDSAAAKAGIDGFGETILDENCGSHLAFGCALPMSYTDPNAKDVHRSGNHFDFVIGTDDMVVTASTREGEIVMLNRGSWADEVTP